MSAITRFSDPLIIKCASYIEDNRTYYNFMSVSKRFQEIGNRDHRECIRRFYEGTAPRPEVLETWLPLPLFSRLLNRSKFTQTRTILPAECLALNGNNALLKVEGRVHLFDLTTKTSTPLKGGPEGNCVALDDVNAIVVNPGMYMRYTIATGSVNSGSVHPIQNPICCALQGKRILIADRDPTALLLSENALKNFVFAKPVQQCALQGDYAFFGLKDRIRIYSIKTSCFVQTIQDFNEGSILACQGDTLLMKHGEWLNEELALHNITQNDRRPLETLNKEYFGKRPISCGHLKGDHALIGLPSRREAILVELSTQKKLALFEDPEDLFAKFTQMTADRCHIVTGKTIGFHVELQVLTTVDFIVPDFKDLLARFVSLKNYEEICKQNNIVKIGGDFYHYKDEAWDDFGTPLEPLTDAYLTSVLTRN